MNIVKVFKGKPSAKEAPKLEGSGGCCGMDILQGIHHTPPERVVEYVCQTYFGGANWHSDKGRAPPFLVFSIAAYQERSKLGRKRLDTEEIADLPGYIEKHHLGIVHQTKKKYNPNSDGYLTAYLWEVDSDRMHRWYKSEFRPRP